MVDDDIEHHTEIRRTGQRLPVWAGVLALVLVCGAILAWPGGDDDPAPRAAATTTPASSARTSAPLGDLPVVHLVAETDRGPRPATTRDGPEPTMTSAGSRFEVMQAGPVVTDGRIVLLADGGLFVGRPRAWFDRVGLPHPVAGLLISNEPGHVWVVVPGNQLALIDLDGIDPPVRLPLDADRVLGPASFGVVTVSPDGAVSWRRPSFDPAPVAVPSGRRAVDAGGDVVLVEGSQPGRGVRQLEARSVVDGSLLQRFAVSGAQRTAVLATDGSAAALPQSAGWIVRDVATGDQLGALPGAFGDPVWIGGGRFAVLVDGGVAVSDGSQLAPPWAVWALAEQSP